MRFLHPNFTKYIYRKVQNWARKGFLYVENCKNVTNTFQLAARIEINRNCVTENRKPQNSYFDCAQCYTFAPYETFWLHVWKSTYLMVIDIVSLLGALLCSTHLVWILEKNIKNWLNESQKANRLITHVSSLFISWQEITDFEKLNPFILDEYPYMIHQNVWNDAPYNICCYFYEFFCVVPCNWYLLLKKATFQFTEYIYGNRLKTHFTCIRCKICWVMIVIRSMLDNLLLIVCIFCIK